MTNMGTKRSRAEASKKKRGVKGKGQGTGETEHAKFHAYAREIYAHMPQSAKSSVNLSAPCCARRAAPQSHLRRLYAHFFKTPPLATTVIISISRKERKGRRQATPSLLTFPLRPLCRKAGAGGEKAEYKI